MEKFLESGDVTTEYGLLDKILKFLTVRDLLTAREVSPKWGKIADSILKSDYKQDPEVIFTKTKTRTDRNESFKNMKSVPDVLITYFDSYSREYDQKAAMNKWQSQKSTTVLHVYCDECFSFTKGKKDWRKSSRDFGMPTPGMSCTISLPRSHGVYYSIFTLYLEHFERDKNILLKMLEDDRYKGPVKCVLIYKTYQPEDSEWDSRAVIERFLRYLFITVNGLQGIKFAYSGGQVKKMCLLQGGIETIPDVCGVMIRGENVLADWDEIVLQETLTNNNYFKNISKNLANIGPESSRVGLMALVDDNSLESYEDLFTDMQHNFIKNIPRVPVCGIRTRLLNGKKVERLTNAIVSNRTSESSLKKKGKNQKPNDRPNNKLKIECRVIILTYLNSRVHF